MEKANGVFGTIKKGFANLTKREQVMIYGLVIIVVLAILIFLIILPAMTNLSELNEEVSKYQTEEMEMRMVIAEAASYDKRFENANKSLKSLKKQFFLPMDPESLDETITALVVKSGLSPKDLQMTTLQQGQIPAYTIQPLAAAGVVETTSGEAAGEGQSTGETGGADGLSAEGGTEAFVYTVSVKAEGDKSKLNNLIDIVNKTSGVELNSYNFSLQNEDAGSGEVTVGGTVDLEFYVYVFVDDTGSVTFEAMPEEESAN